MRYLIIIFLALIMYSCSNGKNAPKGIQVNMLYLIKKIDKKDSWYLIYAERNDSLYKIVSKDQGKENANCNEIMIGKFYNIVLKSRKDNVPEINGIKLKPVNYIDARSPAYDKDGIECYLYDDKTEICIEPEKGIYDLYYTDDLKGICYNRLRN
ncbi:hypothetical protein [Polluticaenibacter yanchengensis]|uniref:Lipoprotein n=1 Tax=Polluticaenibacter yanchengensis TaxID=3014562 RepID=A0ABT4UH87_9BACT|nr:hypothetical protein [Chitinophagaceae bacterium LY-5]